MASQSTTGTVRQRRRALPAKAVALFAAALGAITVGLAIPASADDPASGIIECRSGIVTQGDVSMSSMVVARVPAAQLPDTPGDCSLR
jgi:hypothetical protein